MNLLDLLERAVVPRRAADQDAGNIDWLRARLESGDRAVGAISYPDGLGPWREWVLVVELASGEESTTIPLLLTPASSAYLRSALPDCPVRDPAVEGAPPERSRRDLGARLAELFRTTEELPARERASRLADWILAEVDASRCALIPFEAGTPARPLVFKARDTPYELEVGHIPRRVVASVAQSRQMRSRGPGDRTDDPEETTVRMQEVAAYLAVPVVFGGELLGGLLHR